MPLTVRAATQQAWEALRLTGVTPSVRQVYRQVGGSYPVVAAECRVLRTTAAQAPSLPQWLLPHSVALRALLAMRQAPQTPREQAYFTIVLRVLIRDLDALLTEALENWAKTP